MARKRAVDKSSTVDVKGQLPFLYTSITPVTAEQHNDMRLTRQRSYDFARHVNAIPLTSDEFGQVQRHYPIVFTDGPTPTPVALVGLKKGLNDQVMEDGSWTPGAYVPAYLRRYPFLLVNEKEGGDRQVLCADTSSLLFDADGDALVTAEGEQTERLKSILDFATRYEKSMRRTSKLMAEIAKLDVMQASTVNISRGDHKARIDGFSVISEEKLRDLDDATLAKLVRRGVMPLMTAHHMSLANFSSLSPLS